jgi:hypothetical protein
VIFALGAGLRILTEVAYWPALYYPDSGAYIAQANGSLLSNPAQPAGYPVIIRILRDLGLGFGVLTALQHLAGLAAGGIVYLIIWRLSGRRWPAAAGAAIVMLDAYAIAVEQFVMTDAFFGAMLIAMAALSLFGQRRGWHVLSGVLLALACLIRPVGLFCLPVWLGYELWRQGRSPAFVLCLASVLVPVLGYAAANDAKTGHFALTDDTAWLLYARVAPIGECNGLSLPAEERILCPQPSQRGHGAAYYMYSLRSPAVRAFGLPSTSAPARVDDVLKGYALRVMRQRPLRYLGAVGGDLGAAFVPEAPSDVPLADKPITMASPHTLIAPHRYPRRAPADVLRAYAAVAHTIRPLLGLFVILGVVALVSGGALRPVVALLEGMGLALLFGAALSHFELRYVLPSAPLLTAGGMLAGAALWERWRGRRERATSARRSSCPAAAGRPPAAGSAGCPRRCRGS